VVGQSVLPDGPNRRVSSRATHWTAPQFRGCPNPVCNSVLRSFSSPDLDGLGAAYRLRTGDLRITRSPAHRSRRATCTGGSTPAPECTQSTACTGYRSMTRSTTEPSPD
jgi:hypothetical protein